MTDHPHIPGRATIYATRDGEVVAVMNRPPRQETDGSWTLLPYAVLYVEPENVEQLLSYLRGEGERPPLRQYSEGLPRVTPPPGSIQEYEIPGGGVFNINPLAHAVNGSTLYPPEKRRAADKANREWAERYVSRQGA